MFDPPNSWYTKRRLVKTPTNLDDFFSATLPTLPPRILEKNSPRKLKEQNLKHKEKQRKEISEKNWFHFNVLVTRRSPAGMYQNPVDNGINYLSTGGGCQPSTVSLNHHTGISIDVKFSMWRYQAPIDVGGGDLQTTLVTLEKVWFNGWSLRGGRSMIHLINPFFPRIRWFAATKRPWNNINLFIKVHREVYDLHPWMLYEFFNPKTVINLVMTRSLECSVNPGFHVNPFFTSSLLRDSAREMKILLLKWNTP